jgi:hypothetical protein
MDSTKVLVLSVGAIPAQQNIRVTIFVCFSEVGVA